MFEENVKTSTEIKVDSWTIIYEAAAGNEPTLSIERMDDVILVHADVPDGEAPGDYRLRVQQPCLDIQRSWTGQIDCWRGSELTSIGLRFKYETAANASLPIICHYNRSGENRGVVGLIDHVPVTQVEMVPHIDPPPMRLIETHFTRRSSRGGFRETVVIHAGEEHFVDAIQTVMELCRSKMGIESLPAPGWAREPVWCSWYSHTYHLHQHEVEAQIPAMKKLGIKTALIDASWFHPPRLGLNRGSGDYEVDTNFFPDLPALSKRLRDEGLKTMVWYAPFFMGEETRKRAIMERHCVLKNGMRETRLCPFQEASVKHACETASRLMSDFALDGLKLDFMDQVSHCEDPDHDHGYGNEGAATTRFMAAIRDAIMGVKPDAAIEFRVRYSTLATQSLANCHRGNDSPYDADYMRRENQFIRLYCRYPSAVWNDYAYWHESESSENVSLMLGQQIFSGGVPTFSLDLTKLSEDHERIIAKWMAFYNERAEELAKAKLKVHSADSCFSVASMISAQSAYTLLTGQHVPAEVDLGDSIRKAWLLNASAERRGKTILRAGATSIDVELEGAGPIEVELK